MPLGSSTFSFNAPQACNCSTGLKHMILLPEIEADSKSSCPSVWKKEQAAKETGHGGWAHWQLLLHWFQSGSKENVPWTFENFLCLPCEAWQLPSYPRLSHQSPRCPYLSLFQDMLLLLLLSLFSHVRLCATPQTAAHQAPLSLGFSRQERWSGLPFPSPPIQYINTYIWNLERW